MEELVAVLGRDGRVCGRVWGEADVCGEEEEEGEGAWEVVRWLFSWSEGGRRDKPAKGYLIRMTERRIEERCAVYMTLSLD